MSAVAAKRRVRADSGTSIMEVLTGLAIFGFVAMSVSAATIATIRGNTVSRMNQVASALAYDQIEQFRALDPTANPDALTDGIHEDPNNPITATGEPGGDYSRSWEVTRNAPFPGLAEVLVTVTWRNSEERSVEYATYVCLEEGCA